MWTKKCAKPQVSSTNKRGPPLNSAPKMLIAPSTLENTMTRRKRMEKEVGERIVRPRRGFLTGTAVLLLSVAVDLDRVREINLDICLLLQRILGDRLESLFHVNGLFGAGFKIRNVAL